METLKNQVIEQAIKLLTSIKSLYPDEIDKVITDLENGKSESFEEFVDKHYANVLSSQDFLSFLDNLIENKILSSEVKEELLKNENKSLVTGDSRPIKIVDVTLNGIINAKNKSLSDVSLTDFYSLKDNNISTIETQDSIENSDKQIESSAISPITFGTSLNNMEPITNIETTINKEENAEESVENKEESVTEVETKEENVTENESPYTEINFNTDLNNIEKNDELNNQDPFSLENGKFIPSETFSNKEEEKVNNEDIEVEEEIEKKPIAPVSFNEVKISEIELPSAYNMQDASVPSEEKVESEIKNDTNIQNAKSLNPFLNITPLNPLEENVVKEDVKPVVDSKENNEEKVESEVKNDQSVKSFINIPTIEDNIKKEENNDSSKNQNYITFNIPTPHFDLDEKEESNKKKFEGKVFNIEIPKLDDIVIEKEEVKEEVKEETKENPINDSNSINFERPAFKTQTEIKLETKPTNSEIDKEKEFQKIKQNILEAQLNYLENASRFIQTLERENPEEIYNSLLILNDIRYIYHCISKLSIETLNQLLPYIENNIKENHKNAINIFIEEAIKKTLHSKPNQEEKQEYWDNQYQKENAA